MGAVPVTMPCLFGSVSEEGSLRFQREDFAVMLELPFVGGIFHGQLDRRFVKACGKSGPLSERHVIISVSSLAAMRLRCLAVTVSHSFVIDVTWDTDLRSHSHI